MARKYGKKAGDEVKKAVREQKKGKRVFLLLNAAHGAALACTGTRCMC
jgi:hypothetical protein